MTTIRQNPEIRVEIDSEINRVRSVLMKSSIPTITKTLPLIFDKF